MNETAEVAVFYPERGFGYCKRVEQSTRGPINVKFYFVVGDFVDAADIAKVNVGTVLHFDADNTTARIGKLPSCRNIEVRPVTSQQEVK